MAEEVRKAGFYEGVLTGWTLGREVTTLRVPLVAGSNLGRVLHQAILKINLS